MSKPEIIIESGKFADTLVMIPKRKAVLRSSVARNISGNASIQKAPAPRTLIRKVEKRMKVKFRQRPRIYHDYAAQGKRLRRRTRNGPWQGFCSIVFSKKMKPVDTFIVIPEAYVDDPAARNIVLQHELAEALAVQHGVPAEQAHEIALAFDKRSLKRYKRWQNRRRFYETLKNLHNKNLKGA
jgi:hypothetical protein